MPRSAWAAAAVLPGRGSRRSLRCSTSSTRSPRATSRSPTGDRVRPRPGGGGDTVMHRHGLLLTAVATVTVPGLLAVLAVRGHENVAAGTMGVAAAAVGAAALTGPFPVAPATARASVRNDVAAMQHESGTPVTVLSRVTAGQQAHWHAHARQGGGRRPGHVLPGRGDDLGVGRGRQRQHGLQGLAPRRRPDADPDVERAEPGAGRQDRRRLHRDEMPARPAVCSESQRPWSRCSASITSRSTPGAGRSHAGQAAVVVLYRFDGSLAARYWLDRQTMVPLRRELFDTSDRVIDEDSFVTVQFGAPAGGALAGARGLPGAVGGAAGVGMGASGPAVRVPGLARRQGLAGAWQPERRPAAVRGGLGEHRERHGCRPPVLRRPLRRLALRAERRPRQGHGGVAAAEPRRPAGLGVGPFGHLGGSRLRLHHGRGRARADGHAGRRRPAGERLARLRRPSSAGGLPASRA